MADGDPITMNALLQTVERLWPAARDVSVVSGRGAGAGGSDDQHLLVVPDATSVRLLVPEQRRAAAAAMRRYSAAISTRELVQRLLLGGALRMTARWPLPDRVRISGPTGDSLQSHLGDVLGEHVTVSLGIGSIRANRKPVLGVFDRRGRAVAFVKVGDSPVSTAHVRGEAGALTTVGERTWRMLEVPELLYTGTWHGMFVLVMSTLAATAWQGRNSQWRVPDEAMAELAGAFDDGKMTLAETPMWRKCIAAVDRIGDDSARGRLATGLNGVAERHGSCRVSVGAWHGDFTPWNMARRRGRVQLWDWERFETGVPVGLDRVHYVVHTLTRNRGFTATTVLDGVGRATSGLPGGPSANAAVGAAYLASLSCRYLAAAEGEGGEAIADHASVVVEALMEAGGRVASNGGARWSLRGTFDG